MGAEPTNRTETYGINQDRRFDEANRRLKSTPSILDQDRNSIIELAEHLIAKGVGKLRVVKY